MSHIDGRPPLTKVPSYSSQDGDQSPVDDEGVVSIRLDSLKDQKSSEGGARKRVVTDLTGAQARMRASLSQIGNADEAEESESEPLLLAGDASDVAEENEPVTLTEAEKNQKLSKAEEDDLAKYRDRYANWGSVWGAAIGIAIGAVAGSFIPGLGTVAGAGAGAALGLAIGRTVGWIVGNVKGKRAILNNRLEAKEKRLLEAQRQLPKAKRGAKGLRGGALARSARRASMPVRGAVIGASLISKRRRQTEAPGWGRLPSHGASSRATLGEIALLFG